MVVAETSAVLAGVSLLKSAVDGIRKTIQTCQSVSDLSNDLDNFFDAKDQINEQKESGVLGKWQNLLQKKIGSTSNKLSIGTVAKKHIDRKLMEENYNKISRMIDLRFGTGTFAGIEFEHAEILKKSESEATQNRRKKSRQLAKAAEILGGILVVAVAIIGFIFYIKWAKK
tara:strand:+ start:1288 stop:1800 length:513 start_codon:yes stop_codon:yes gene_type:complete